MGSQDFNAMDLNADGYISRDEFVKAFEPELELPKHPSADDLINAARQKKNAQKVCTTSPQEVLRVLKKFSEWCSWCRCLC